MFDHETPEERTERLERLAMARRERVEQHRATRGAEVPWYAGGPGAKATPRWTAVMAPKATDESSVDMVELAEEIAKLKAAIAAIHNK